MLIKEGDTLPVAWRVLDCNTGQPVDLTGAIVEVHAQRRGSAPITLPSFVIPPESEGRVQYTPDGTLSPGSYAVEIQFTKSGVIGTSPTDGTGTLTVQAQIA